MNSKKGGKMTENEFLLYLNTLTISEEYDDAYFKKLFQALFMFLNRIVFPMISLKEMVN